MNEDSYTDCRAVYMASEVFDNSGSAPLFTARPIKSAALMIGIGYLVEERFNETWGDSPSVLRQDNESNQVYYIVTNEASPRVYARTIDEQGVASEETDVTTRFLFTNKVPNSENCLIPDDDGRRYYVNRALLIDSPFPAGEYIFRIRMVCTDGRVLETETRPVTLL